MSHGTFSITVKDPSGNAIPNAEVQYSVKANASCPWYAVGCESVGPYSGQDYTGSDGKVGIPLDSTVAQTVSIIVMANGYSDLAKSVNVNGANSTNWNVWGSTTVTMTPISQTPPPGQGITAPGTQWYDSVAGSLGYGLQEVAHAGMVGSIELTVIVIFVAIAMIAVAVIMMMMP